MGGPVTLDHVCIHDKLGKTSAEKKRFLSTRPPNLGNLVLFLGRKKLHFARMTDFFYDDNDGCNDNHDDNDGNFDDKKDNNY